MRGSARHSPCHHCSRRCSPSSSSIGGPAIDDADFSLPSFTFASGVGVGGGFGVGVGVGFGFGVGFKKRNAHAFLPSCWQGRPPASTHSLPCVQPAAPAPLAGFKWPRREGE